MLKLLSRLFVFGILGCGLLFVISLFSPSKPQVAATQAPNSTVPINVSTSQSTNAPNPTQADSPTPAQAVDRSILLTQAVFTDQQTQAAAGQPVQPSSIQPSIAPVQALSYSMTIYVQGRSLNVRSCASRECSIVAPLMGGEKIQATGTVDGEIVTGTNSMWYRVDYFGREGYVYSEYVSQQPPTNVPQIAPTVAPIQQIPVSTRPPSNSPQYTCNGINDLNCGNFPPDGLAAQQHLQACGVDEDDLDRDNDGLACEYTGR